MGTVIQDRLQINHGSQPALDQFERATSWLIPSLSVILAKDGEGARSLQPLLLVNRSFFLGAYRGKVADPVIEAENPGDQ